jgi:hypothetical protein
MQGSAGFPGFRINQGGRRMNRSDWDWPKARGEQLDNSPIVMEIVRAGPTKRRRNEGTRRATDRS